MSQLYSVTFTRRQLISVFDEKGKKIDDREERISVTLHDLPYTTAEAYKGKDPNAVITRQYEQPQRGGKTSFKHSGKGSGKSFRKADRNDFADMGSKPAPASNIHTGTYGALVNTIGGE
jgi:hypothetical protein